MGQYGCMTNTWQRLADCAMRRRAELGLTQIEVSRRGPMSLDRVQAIEGAKRGSYRMATLMALERALQWEPGSVDAILEGGEPTPLGRTVYGAARAVLGGQATARGEVRTAREVRQEKIAAAKAAIREALGESEQPPAEDVDAYRLEERIARLRRLMAQRRDTESAAELDLMLRMYEEGEETG